VKSSTLTSFNHRNRIRCASHPGWPRPKIIAFDAPGAGTGTSNGQGSQIHAVDRVTENNFTVDTGHSNNSGGEHE
jgi:hypothetical protein